MEREARLYLAWLVALTATLGSLYFSEVRDYVPCVLCWFQRIMMYPLAIILGIASFRRDWSVRIYVLPLAAVGWVFAGYHILEERGVAATLKVCEVGQSTAGCDIRWIEWFGFITIPVLSFTAFTLILLLLGLPGRLLTRR